jgi:mannose-1-phosphate guanylyltransferase
MRRWNCWQTAFKFQDMKNNNKNFYAVIMAGGVGSRFWPVSTSKFPKQFHDMLGVGETLLQGTYNRMCGIVPAENIFILTHEDYRQLIKEQLPLIKDDQIIPEPVMRNTAPCILLSAMKIAAQNPDACMLVAPSDHWIKDQEAFGADIRKAFKYAEKGENLITIGIKPHFANTGYGYIQTDEQEGNLRKVVNFTEKPDQKKAERFLEKGNYLWNSGIFIWKASVITERFATYLPEMYDLFEQGKSKLNQPDEAEFIKATYPKAENISIDYGIMEESRNVYVIAASFD